MMLTLAACERSERGAGGSQCRLAARRMIDGWIRMTGRVGTTLNGLSSAPAGEM